MRGPLGGRPTISYRSVEVIRFWRSAAASSSAPVSAVATASSRPRSTGRMPSSVSMAVLWARPSRRAPWREARRRSKARWSCAPMAVSPAASAMRPAMAQAYRMSSPPGPTLCNGEASSLRCVRPGLQGVAESSGGGHLAEIDAQPEVREAIIEVAGEVSARRGIAVRHRRARGKDAGTRGIGRHSGGLGGKLGADTQRSVKRQLEVAGAA
jgi:hypothetical protein